VRAGFLWTFLLFCGYVGVAFTETDYDGVFEMSFQELFDVKTFTGSKRDEPHIETPSVVSYLKASDITLLGIQTVSESISFLTGVNHFTTYFGQYNQFAIRNKVASEHYNTKLLFLLNGHPIYTSGKGAFEADWVPIEAIETIELVRGPASVLFGTNALSGVINIVTKTKLPDQENIGIRYQRARYDTDEVRITSSAQDESLRYMISTTLRFQNGEPIVGRPDQNEAGIPFNSGRKHEYQNVFANLGWGDFSLDFLYGEITRRSTIGIVPDPRFDIDQFENEYISGDFRYEPAIGENSKLHVITRYDYFDDSWKNDGLSAFDPTVAFDDADARGVGYKYGVETYAEMALTNDANLITGVLYDFYRVTKGYVAANNPLGYSPVLSAIGGSVDNRDFAAYANFDYKLWGSNKLVGGARFTDNRVTKENLNYRVGMVSELSPRFTLKTLWGTSYRSPSIFEVFSESAVIQGGGSNLDFETLKGLDVQLLYSDTFDGAQIYSAVTYFYDDTSDFISRGLVGGRPAYVNIAGEKTQGVEWEVRFVQEGLLQVLANGSHLLDSEDKSTGSDLQYVIDHLINVTLSFDLSDDLTLAVANQYRSNWGSASPVSLSNLTVRYDRALSFGRFEVFSAVTNLFDDEYEYPEFVRRNIDTIPGGPGRSWVVGGGIFF
jgi:outer membrane receptor for ferrienterochelin and colicins